MHFNFTDNQINPLATSIYHFFVPFLAFISMFAHRLCGLDFFLHNFPTTAAWLEHMVELDWDLLKDALPAELPLRSMFLTSLVV